MPSGPQRNQQPQLGQLASQIAQYSSQRGVRPAGWEKRPSDWGGMDETGPFAGQASWTNVHGAQYNRRPMGEKWNKWAMWGGEAVASTLYLAGVPVRGAGRGARRAAGAAAGAAARGARNRWGPQGPQPAPQGPTPTPTGPTGTSGPTGSGYRYGSVGSPSSRTTIPIPAGGGTPTPSYRFGSVGGSLRRTSVPKGGRSKPSSGVNSAYEDIFGPDDPFGPSSSTGPAVPPGELPGGELGARPGASSGDEAAASTVPKTKKVTAPKPKSDPYAGTPPQTIGNSWGRPDPERIPGTPVQSIGNPWAYESPRLMQLFFAGAEVPSHLSVLKDCGVERVAVSITNLVRSVGDSTLGTWATTERLGGLEWVLYADSNHVPVGPALEVLKDCEVPPEMVTGPIDWYEQTWLSNTDLLFLPIWDAADPTMLRDYTSNYDGVTLPDVVVSNPTAVRQARASIHKLGQLAALTGRSKGIERFDTLVSSAWWAVQKYGETQVWAGNRMVRLNAEDKLLKRERYGSAIEALGCDLGKIMEDDPTEILRLSVVSWQHLEQHLARGRAVATVPLVNNGQVPITPVTVISPNGVANPVPHTRHEVLPVIGLGTSSHSVHDADGNEVEEHFSTIQVTPESLRQCNTCVLAVSCPMHSPNALCSYKIPVEIKSKPQLVGVLRAITEIQTQRILMGRFSEEIMGEPNPDLGKEMDRLFSMVERWRTIEDTRDSVKMTLEARGDAHASMGVISRLFGARAGANATLLETPIDSNEIIHDMTDDD